MTNDRAWLKALRYLQLRPRSEAELRAYLVKKGFSAAETDKAIGRLVHLGYIDDQKYGRMLIAGFMAQKGHAERRIRFDLEKRGLEDDLIDSLLAEVHSEGGEEDRALAQAKKFVDRNRSLNRESLKRRLYGHLDRRGYRQNTILRTFAKLGID